MEEFLSDLKDFMCPPIGEHEEVINVGWGGGYPGEKSWNWGIKHSEEWKINQSIGVKKSWVGAEQRKKSVSDRNKKVKSQEMKDRWKNPTEKMKIEKERFREMSKTIPKPWTKNKRNRSGRMVYACGIIYNDAFSASDAFGISAANVRRKCRLNTYPDWYYL